MNLFAFGGYLLFVQFRPRNCRDQQNFASWPSFWYLAELELVGSRPIGIESKCVFLEDTIVRLD